MLKIVVYPPEQFDEAKGEFIYPKGRELRLEHSLISLSKWESKWTKPLITTMTKMTFEESIDYIRCMTITQNVDPETYTFITEANVKEIIDYMQAPMTATIFSTKTDHKINQDIITSEIIYYWMVALTIPFECQTWHINRLLALIDTCNLKNQPAKKMTPQQILAQNRDLNEKRRRELNTKG